MDRKPLASENVNLFKSKDHSRSFVGSWCRLLDSESQQCPLLNWYKKKPINSTYMIYFWKQHRYSLWVFTKQFVKNRNIDSKQKENKFLRFSCQIELHDTHHNTSLVQSRHNHYEACTVCIVFTSTVLIIHIHVWGEGYHMVCFKT